MTCKDCVHYSVCKFPNQEICKGTKVSDLAVDGCVDFNFNRGEWTTLSRRKHYQNCKSYELPQCSICSICGCISIEEYNFCPHCGAKMKGEKENA